MPQHSTNIHASILQYTLVAVDALQAVAEETQIPFLKSVCSLSASIIPMIDNTKFQKDRGLRMIQDIHRVLCALMALCLHTETVSSPQMLRQLAEYGQILQKFYACLRAQQELGTIKRFFKESEITAQLDVCERDLAAASDIFITQYGVGTASALVEMHVDTEGRHQELLELIATRSDSLTTTSSTRGNSVNNSSDSFSLLPGSPKIFHGRDSELKELVHGLLTDSPRIAVLGPGGIGKTALVIAGLHQPTITEKYNLRYFISCESANTSSELMSIIGTHLGLEPSRQLSKTIVRHFEESRQCLLVLDNFETTWEPLESRGGTEELLSLLADVSTLAVVITMRGTERPAKVKWNRPFLPPLEPLATSTSREIFSEVADEPDIGEESALEELLVLSGSLPLAISLMASIASFEGYNETLSRWKAENTTLLSDGHDKRSNLEISISLSLGSPRISSSPDAKNLLSLLSILPDGITEEDIAVSKVPLPTIAHTRSTLVRTSLAYVDSMGRLRALSPIREYMRRVHPPSVSLAKPLRIHFQGLLTIWKTHNYLHSGNLGPQLVSCLGNINDLLLQGLIDDQPAWHEIGHSILTLNSFSRTMLMGSSLLIQKLPSLIEATGDSRLRWLYACAYLRAEILPRVDANAELLIPNGIEYFTTVQCDIEEVVKFYLSACFYHGSANRNLAEATEFVNLALTICQETNNNVLRADALLMKCQIAHSGFDAHEMINLVREVRKSWGLTLNGVQEANFLYFEAFANAVILGNYPRALGLCSAGEELLIASGMESSIIHLYFLDIQADIHWHKTEYHQAHDIMTIIASKTSPSRSPRYHAHALGMLAYLETVMSSSDEAVILRNLNRAKAVQRDLGSKRILMCSWVAAEMELYRGCIKNARVAFEECLSGSRGVFPDLQLECLAALGDPRRSMHDPIEAFPWAYIYLSFARKSKERVATFHALRCLADICAASQDEETALNLYYTALQGATEIDVHRLRAESMTGIGDILMRRGDSVRAKEMWEAARPLFVRSSKVKDAAAIDTRMEKLSEDSGKTTGHGLEKIPKPFGLELIS